MYDVYVYAADCEDFANFGLVGALTPISCEFEEAANGLSEITLIHPLDSFGRFLHLAKGNILKVFAPVRAVPEIRNGQIVTTVEIWNVKDQAVTTKAQRTLYKRATGSSKRRVLDAGTSVVVVEKPAEGRYKVQTEYGNGYMEPDGLLYSTTQNLANNSQSIESVLPAWNVRTQIFRIYAVQPGMHSITVRARHISYDLLGNMVKAFENAGAVSAGDALNGILNNCLKPHDFRGYTNLADTRVGVNYTRKNPISALLDPEEGMTAHWECALIRDDYDLYLLRNPGLNRGVTVEYAKNLLGIDGDDSDEDVVTTIIPIGETKDGEPLLLDGDTYWIDSPLAGNYPTPHVQELKCENCKVGTDGVTEEIARARMREQALAAFADGADQPAVSMKIKFVSLGDTAEFAQYKSLDRLFLWDYVIVRHAKLGIDVTARIVRIRWNCLTGRMISTEIGTPGKTLANTGINTWQVPQGFSGSKIAGGTVGSAALMQDVIAARHLQTESVNTEALQAACVTAIKIAAGAITADKLEAESVEAKIIEAVAAKIGTLTAGSITTDKLAAALAQFGVITAGTATFDRATIAHLVAEALHVEFGVGDQAFIRNLAVAYAQMVGATIGELCIKASDGNYYLLDVNADGSVSATKSTITQGEINAGMTSGGKVILETNMVVDNLSTTNLLGTFALINKIDAERIDVDTLFARQAVIDVLIGKQIFGDKSLSIVVGDLEKLQAQRKNRIFRQDAQPTMEDKPEPGDLWITSQSAQYQAVEADVQARWAMDDEGNLGYEIIGDYSGQGFKIEDGTLYSDDLPFTIADDGTPVPVLGWVPVLGANADARIEGAVERSIYISTEPPETAQLGKLWLDQGLTYPVLRECIKAYDTIDEDNADDCWRMVNDPALLEEVQKQLDQRQKELEKQYDALAMTYDHKADGLHIHRAVENPPTETVITDDSFEVRANNRISTRIGASHQEMDGQTTMRTTTNYLIFGG